VLVADGSAVLSDPPNTDSRDPLGPASSSSSLSSGRIECRNPLGRLLSLPGVPLGVSHDELTDPAREEDRRLFSFGVKPPTFFCSHVKHRLMGQSRQAWDEIAAWCSPFNVALPDLWVSNVTLGRDLQ
jgi:hypothetical protein